MTLTKDDETMNPTMREKIKVRSQSSKMQEKNVDKIYDNIKLKDTSGFVQMNDKIISTVTK